MENPTNKVFRVFQEVFSLSADINRDELVYNEYAGWDSVGHMTLVAGLEEAFDCMMDMQDILDLSSFDKAVAIMAKYNE